MTESLYHKQPQQRGAVLPVVLLTILFLTLLGFMALNTASVEVRLAANERDYQQAVYAAEGGIAHTRALLKGLLNACNQSNIASGSDVDWDFVLMDTAGECSPLTGQPRPLSIQAELGLYQYQITIRNNSDDPSLDPLDDQDQKIILTSIATSNHGVRVGIEMTLDAENSDSSDDSGYSGQFGAGGGKSFVGRDTRAITDMSTTELGRL